MNSNFRLLLMIVLPVFSISRGGSYATNIARIMPKEPQNQIRAIARDKLANTQHHAD